MHKFLYWLISSTFLFHCHIQDLKFFYKLSFQVFNCFLSLFVSVQVSDAYVNVLSIVVFFSLNFSFFDMFLFLKKLKLCEIILNYKLYYQLLHSTYLCNLATYQLQTPWGWHNSVKTCRSVTICQLIVHVLVSVQNKKKNVIFVYLTVNSTEEKKHRTTCNN